MLPEPTSGDADNGHHTISANGAVNGASGGASNGVAALDGAEDRPNGRGHQARLPIDRDLELDSPALIESLLFVTDQPISLADLGRVLDLDRRGVEKALEALAGRLDCRGVRVQRDNGHVQMVSAPESASAVQRFLGLEASGKLSKAALETLAIVAYEQPVTRPEVDDLRGVNSDGVLRTLLARGLVEEVGRRETVGLPIEYGTTFLFLEYFGLEGLDALPPVEDFAELVPE